MEPIVHMLILYLGISGQLTWDITAPLAHTVFYYSAVISCYLNEQP